MSHVSLKIKIVTPAMSHISEIISEIQFFWGFLLSFNLHGDDREILFSMGLEWIINVKHRFLLFKAMV